MFRGIEPRSVDEPRTVKVIVVGAGISGIIAGIRFPQRIPNLELVIYDKNEDIGGTWFENRYPGVACGMSICVATLQKLLTSQTSRPIRTSYPSNRTPDGPSSMLPEETFISIGKELQPSTESKSTCALAMK